MISIINKTSKVTPISNTKYDNFLAKVKKIKQRYRFTIWIQSLLGFDRIYLLTASKPVRLLCRLNTLALVTLTLYHIYEESFEGSRQVYRDTICIEYILLIFTSLFLNTSKYEDFFKNLQDFDEMLNISDDLSTTCPISRSILLIVISITYTIGEYTVLNVFVFDLGKQTSLILLLTLLAHDIELIFFCSLLRCVLNRVFIIKAHVRNAFSQIGNGVADKIISKLENLSKKTQLDTTSMHCSYELLHKCADQLNSLMSFPMIVILFASGLSTTLLMKNVFQLAQSTNLSTLKVNILIIYGSLRCFKYTFLIVMPCLFSSITTKQVTVIRTLLHDTINTLSLEKIERRKVKAFFQLTQDNEFSYALWGVIKLDMSLPLSYLSICTTYLVIIIQFSKFID